MDSEGYKQAWVRPSTLEGLNKRIHDGVPLEQLADRAADRRDTFFELLFPYARPTDGARVLELGPGVGWIMESMLERYPIAEIVGLDVSPVMIESAQRALERSTRRATCSTTACTSRWKTTRSTTSTPSRASSTSRSTTRSSR